MRKLFAFMFFMPFMVQFVSALEISNSTNTPTTNSAAIYATLTNVIVATTATCYYGTTDGGTSSASWAYSTNYADATNGAVSVTVTNLAPATYYFYRWYAADSGTNTNSTAWAASSSNFTTVARAPTNYPTPGAGVTVIADTNGVLLSPSNFFTGNSIATSGTVATVQSNLDVHVAGTNPHSITPAQIGALAGSSNLGDVADADIARSNLGAAAQADLEKIISQTNQVIDVNGIAYIITNAPAAAGDVLMFDPASTTAQFVAQTTNLSGFNNDAGFVTNAPTNQIIVVDGTAYTITNAPAGTELHELVLDPGATTGYFRAQSTPFQKFSGTVNAIAATATVSFAHGSLVKISATNDTTITFDNTDYPTNGVGRVRIALYAYTNAIAFDSAIINTNDFTPTLATNTPDSVTDLFFTRTTTNQWNGRY